MMPTESVSGSSRPDALPKPSKFREFPVKFKSFASRNWGWGVVVGLVIFLGVMFADTMATVRDRHRKEAAYKATWFSDCLADNKKQYECEALWGSFK